MDEKYRDLFWNNPLYKPKNTVHEVFWVEFLQTAKLLLILDQHKDKAGQGYREPDIYSVFNKMRQDIHNELPYSKESIREVDRSVDRWVENELKGRKGKEVYESISVSNTD